jgi:hypothetical protein
MTHRDSIAIDCLAGKTYHSSAGRKFGPRQFACMKMFRQLMTLLTAATFVAHGLWGCCWHHARACAHRESAHSVPTSPAAGCCKHCGRAAETGGRQAPATPCKLQCRGACFYVAPQKGQMNALQIDLRLDFAAVVVLQTARYPLSTVEVRRGADDPDAANPSARLHLMHQVFLI